LKQELSLRLRLLGSTRVDRVVGFGLAMAFFGVPFTAFSYLVLLSVPLTALGLACVILGATIVLTPSSPVPKKAIRAMVEGSCVNVEALLEEFNATEKAFYLPPREGRVYALVPLRSNPHLPDADKVMKAPLRVITQVGGSPGLLVFPPGSELIRLSGLSSGGGLEDALRHVLVDFVEAVESVKAVREDDRVVVDLEKPRVGTDFPNYGRVLGSLATSIAGCVLAFCLEVPVLFNEERAEGKKVRAVFRVIS